MAAMGRPGHSSAAKQCDVVLVGRQLEDNENLGLGYLGAALHGLAAVERLILNRAEDLEATAQAILSLAPQLVGLSIPDGGSAHLPLALGQLLKHRGYSGHISAGGQFATLARAWLLERYGWLSSVVRFAGEAPLRQLVIGLRQHDDLGEVPGLTTRCGDGPPAPVASPLPMQLRPLRSGFPQLLGHGVAFVQATRGCIGRCAYCGPAALQSLEVAEGERAGFDATTLRRLGVGGVRRRPVSDLCDEIAALYRTDARYCYFVDEHVLPHQEAQALEFLSDLRLGLERRRVQRLGFGCMLRAEFLTDAIIDAFADAGLVRAFIGLELATPAEGRRYRRRVDPLHAQSVLQRLDAAKVATVTNLMLVHPESTVDTIERAIDLMSTIDVGSVEVTRMQVYHGTRLASELERAGRLTGNPLRYGYRLDDPAAERFVELLVQLRLKAFGDHSVGAATHALALSVSLGTRLEEESLPAGIVDASRELSRVTRSLYVKAYRDALALAVAPRSTESDARSLVDDTARETLGLLRRIERQAQSIERWAKAPRPLFVPMRAAASTSLVFALAASAACGGEVAEFGSTNSKGGQSALGGASSAGAAGTFGGATSQGPLACDEYVSRVVSAVKAQVPCFEGYLDFTGFDHSVHANWDSPPFADCSNGSSHGTLGSTHAAQAEVAANAVTGRPTSLCGQIAWIEPPQKPLTDLSSAARACGWDGWSSSFVVIVDAAGKVTDVVASTRGSIGESALACLLAALKDLTFPCFPNSAICPMEVILE